MARPRVASPETVAEWAAAYEAGASLRTIKARAGGGVSLDTVYRRLLAAGVVTRGAGPIGHPAATRERAREMRRAAVPSKVIAARLGVSVGSVLRWTHGLVPPLPAMTAAQRRVYYRTRYVYHLPRADALAEAMRP